MRTQFIPHPSNPEWSMYSTSADTLAGASEVAPWAAEIVEVDGGFQAFESADDAQTWRNQV